MKQWMLRITAYADRLLDDLELLDWTDAIKSQQRNWIGRSTGAEVTFATPAGPLDRVHHPARHAVRRHLHGRRPRAPAGRRPDHRRARGCGRCVRRRGRPPLGSGPPDRGQGQDRRLHRDHRHQPGERPGDPGLRRRLRPHGLRHRRHHGRALRRPARLRVRPGVRPADRRHGATARRVVRPPRHRRRRPHRPVARGLQGRRRGDRLVQRRHLARRPGRRRGQGRHHRLAGGRGPGPRARSSTSCATGCSAASATGASRSPSSSATTASRRPCPQSELPLLLPPDGRLLPDDLRRRGLRAGAAAGPHHRVDLGRPRPGRRSRRPTGARSTPCPTGPGRAGTSCGTSTRRTTDVVRRPGERALLDGPAVRGRLRRRRPVRGRRRARGAAPALRPVLAQGPVRPGPRVVGRAVPPPVQPGDDPGPRVPRRPRLPRARRGRGRRGRPLPATRARRSPASWARWASR